MSIYRRSLWDSLLLFIFLALRFCFTLILLTLSRVDFFFFCPLELSITAEADRGLSYILWSLSSFSSMSSLSLNTALSVWPQHVLRTWMCSACSQTPSRCPPLSPCPPEAQSPQLLADPVSARPPEEKIKRGFCFGDKCTFWSPVLLEIGLTKNLTTSRLAMEWREGTEWRLASEGKSESEKSESVSEKSDSEKQESTSDSSSALGMTELVLASRGWMMELLLLTLHWSVSERLGDSLLWTITLCSQGSA